MTDAAKLTVEDGRWVDVAGQQTWVVDQGDGPVVLLLHGSGPGVSGLANWRLTIPGLVAAGFRAIAPDQLGFGRTVPPDHHDYSMKGWVDHAIALLDALEVERAHVIGNSFGGALALSLATRRPDLVDRLVLMGSVGVPFLITEGLDRVWGYVPSVDEMAELMKVFAYDASAFGRELAEVRYQASIADGADVRFARMFPAPRQRWVDAMATPFAAIRRISAPTLVVHGRDDQVIPIETSLTLARLLPDVRLHVFGACGHWTQLEKTDEFNTLVAGFLARRGAQELAD